VGGKRYCALNIFTSVVIWILWKTRNNFCFQGGRLEELGGSFGRIRETNQELGDPEQAERCTEAGGMSEGMAAVEARARFKIFGR
jgi:hypothetical protein